MVVWDEVDNLEDAELDFELVFVGMTELLDVGAAVWLTETKVDVRLVVLIKLTSDATFATGAVSDGTAEETDSGL